MRKRNFLIVTVVLIILSATHWFAYDNGLRSAIDSDAPTRESALADDPFAALLCQVDVLNAAAKCPDAFSKEDLRKWRTETEATLREAETTTLDFCKKSGDEGREFLVRAKIRKAHDLLAKLPR